MTEVTETTETTEVTTEDAATETVETQTEVTESTETKTEVETRTFTQDEVTRLLGRETKKAKETALAAVQGDLAAKDVEALRYKVALEKALPPVLAERLKGSTAEELAADADALLGIVAKPAPASGGFDGGVRETTSTIPAQQKEGLEALDRLFGR